MSKRILTLLLTAAAALVAHPSLAGDWGRHTGRFDFGGVVYVMTNDSDANQLRVYLRNPAGKLRPVNYATVSTGGQGGADNAAIDPLGSQGALVYDGRHGLLFAVNAGSDSVAALDTSGRSLRPRLTDVEPSGGYIPVSVAVSEDRLYVLNAGDSGSVATFAIGHHGDLTPLGTLDLGLDPAATSIPFGQVPAPNQVGVDALARHLIVAHAGGKELLTAELDDDGVPGGTITSTTTPGDGPFAFDLTRYGTTLVAEAASGSVSAFDPPSGTDALTVTAAAVPTGQMATCWIVVHDDGYAYVSNTGSNTIGLYAWTRTGQLTLVNAAAASATGAPIDLALANGGGFLYSLDAESGSISGFRILPGTGALQHVETQGGLPAAAGLQGIAARDF
ncbi:MAG: beta-propeller fold lactonase family protein [Woeseiaceae bacterium]